MHDIQALSKHDPVIFVNMLDAEMILPNAEVRTERSLRVRRETQPKRELCRSCMEDERLQKSALRAFFFFFFGELV